MLGGTFSLQIQSCNDSVIPVHLLELSPEHFRSFVVGTSYQLGNLISSASSTIEATAGERFPLPPLPNGDTRYDYGKVMAIFMGSVYAYGTFTLNRCNVANWAVILMTMIGPEARKVDHVKLHEGQFADGAVVEKGVDEGAEVASSESGGRRAPSDDTFEHKDAKLTDNKISEAGGGGT